ncbi:unnamed protein product [Camellia sinensis]
MAGGDDTGAGTVGVVGAVAGGTEIAVGGAEVGAVTGVGDLGFESAGDLVGEEVGAVTGAGDLGFEGVFTGAGDVGFEGAVAGGEEGVTVAAGVLVGDEAGD